MKKTVLALAVTLAMPMSAEAQFLTKVSPDCNASVFNPAYVLCSGAYDGNDVNQQTNVLKQLDADFGDQDWARTETVNGGATGTFFSSVPESNDDKITFSQLIKGKFVVALKTNTNFSFFLMDGGVAGISEFEFTTDGVSVNGNQVAQELSHASLYQYPGGGGGDCTIGGTCVVPEPSTYMLMASGLFGLGFLARRRRNNV
jgi:PEP-CTERM motif